MVLILTFELPEATPGGIATVAAQKIALFAASGWRVKVVGPDSGYGTDGAIVPASAGAAQAFAPIQPLGNLAKFRQMLRAAWRLARAERPTLVYGLSGTYVGLVAWLLHKRFRIPYVLMAHGNEFLRFTKTFGVRTALRGIYNNSTAVSAVSGFTAGRLRILGVESSRILVVHNGVDTEFFRPPASDQTRAVREKLAGDKRFMLLTVSRLDSRKNHLGVIRALAELRDTNPEVLASTVYVVCGSGPMESAITAEVERRGLLDTVLLAGYVGQGELTAYYAAADVVIMPVVLEEDVGSVEGFGLVFLEAAACGTPAIAGKAGGVPDAVADGETGIHVDGTKDAEIARAIRALYEDAGLRRRMADQAYRRATTEFELRNVFRRELQQIERLLDRASNRESISTSGKDTQNG